MTRDDVHIEHARLFDWPSIVSLRNRYFAQFDREVQGRPDATWVVCRRGEIVIGCYSYEYYAVYDQTWVLDFYRTPGHDGTLAVAAMYRHIVEHLASVHDVLFTVDPLNTAQEIAVQKHGAEDVGHMYRFKKGHH